MLTSNRTRPAPSPGRRFHPVSSTALLAVLVLASVAVQETEATAQDAVSCPPGQVVGPGPEPGERLCYAYTSGGVLPIDQPLRVTAPAGGGVQQWCYRRNDGVDGRAGPHRVPCRTDVGWYSPRWDCYVENARMSELAGAEYEPPRWDLADGEPGRLWRVRCFPPKEHPQGPMWLHSDTDPIGVWIRSMLLVGPVIATSPPLHRGGIVNLPIWLWTEDRGRTWPDTPLYARADARPDGIDAWVDVWAEPVRITWYPGDGSAPIICDHPGVRWQRGMGDEGHGECAHTYRWHSHDEPGGAYTLTGVTAWRLRWQVNGGTDSGVLDVQVGSTSAYEVMEVHVLVYYR